MEARDKSELVRMTFLMHHEDREKVSSFNLKVAPIVRRALAIACGLPPETFNDNVELPGNRRSEEETE